WPEAPRVDAVVLDRHWLSLDSLSMFFLRGPGKLDLGWQQFDGSRRGIENRETDRHFLVALLSLSDRDAQFFALPVERAIRWCGDWRLRIVFLFPIWFRRSRTL